MQQFLGVLDRASPITSQLELWGGQGILHYDTFADAMGSHHLGLQSVSQGLGSGIMELDGFDYRLLKRVESCAQGGGFTDFYTVYYVGFASAQWIPYSLSIQRGQYKRNYAITHSLSAIHSTYTNRTHTYPPITFHYRSPFPEIVDLARFNAEQCQPGWVVKSLDKVATYLECNPLSKLLTPLWFSESEANETTTTLSRLVKSDEYSSVFGGGPILDFMDRICPLNVSRGIFEELHGNPTSLLGAWRETSGSIFTGSADLASIVHPNRTWVVRVLDGNEEFISTLAQVCSTDVDVVFQVDPNTETLTHILTSTLYNRFTYNVGAPEDLVRIRQALVEFTWSYVKFKGDILHETYTRYHSAPFFIRVRKTFSDEFLLDIQEDVEGGIVIESVYLDMAALSLWSGLVPS